MKHKNTFNTIAALLILIITNSSCSFLDSDPYDFVSPQTFYKNEKDCRMALAGVYYTLVTEPVYGNYYSCMISNIDDLSYYTRPAGITSSEVFGNGHGASDKNIYDTWDQLYKGIKNANVLLENIDDAEMKEDIRNNIKGEAQFLRAYYHFLLAQGWHSIPLRDSSLKDVNNAMTAATPHEEVINWVIQEMEEAVTLVDNETYDSSPSHIKKNTVMGILARVSLWRAGFPTNGGQPFYEKALYWATEVQKSNKHSLNPDVYTLWKNMSSNKYDKEYNESIWEAEFYGTRIDGNYTAGRIGNVIGNIQLSVLDDGPGYSYGFYSGSLILWDLFEDGDNRKDLSMAPYQINRKGEIIDWRDNQIIQRRCGKYRREWEASKIKHKNYTEQNYPLLRYADVLLMIAESANEVHQGPTPEAYEAINEVRKRAGISSLKNLSYTDFQEEVRNERARELCFESTRKYDLIRWGIYVDAIHNKLAEKTYDKRWSTGNNFIGARDYAERTSDKHQFLPIPNKELSVNKLLEQNSFW